MIDPTCPDCQKLTGGDCGKHNSFLEDIEDKNVKQLKAFLGRNPITAEQIKDFKVIDDFKTLGLRSLLDLPLIWVKFILNGLKLERTPLCQ